MAAGQRQGIDVESSGTPPEDRAEASSQAQAVHLHTLLLSDLVSSTQLLRDHGDARAFEIFSAHDRLARQLLERYGGREIDKTDGFLMLFPRPVDAVRYALAFHRELLRMSREWKIDLRARVGVHVGEVFLHENSPEDVARGAKPIEVEGLAKPLAARVMSLAGGGQTLLTPLACDLARKAMDGSSGDEGELTWMGHGAYFFKGIGQGVEVFEVGEAGIAPLAAPAGSAKAQRRRRPRWLVPAAALVLLILAITAYRVWLGSSGETRLAVAVLGLRNLSGDPESAWLSTALSELLASQLAAGGQLRLIPGENVARMKRELAIQDAYTFADDTLDNIRDNLGTDWVLAGSYLAVGEEVRLLLHLQSTGGGGPPLAAETTGTLAELLALVSDAGDQLRQHLRLEDLSPEQVGEVTATLASSPEATRLYAEGLARLRERNASAARDSLEQAIASDPDYALTHAALSEAWQALGYDQKAAASAGRALELAGALSREEALTIEGRYRKASADWPGAVETYGVLWDFFDDNVEHGLQLAGAQLSAGRANEALATAASLRALPSPVGEDPRIDLVESDVLESMADYDAALAMAEQAVVKGRGQRAWILVADAHYQQAWVLRQLGRVAQAAETLEEAELLYNQAGDRSGVASVLSIKAVLARFRGDAPAAEKLVRRALEVQDEIGNVRQIARLSNSLALLIQGQGDLAAAAELFDDAVAGAREVDYRSGEMLYLGNHSIALLDSGNLTEARRLAEEALALRDAGGTRSSLSWTYFFLGRIAVAAGELPEARGFYRQVLEISEEASFRRQSAATLSRLARVYFHEGDLATAVELADRSGAIRSELGEKGTLAELALLQPALSLEHGRLEEAVAQAREAMDDFTSEGVIDARIAAAAVLADALRTTGRLAAASDVLDGARPLAESLQHAMVRLSFAIADARLESARGIHDRALGRLEAVAAEAGRRGFVGLELSARLALGEAELTAGNVAAGRARLAELAAAAADRDFGLIARKASAGAGTSAG